METRVSIALGKAAHDASQLPTLVDVSLSSGDTVEFTAGSESYYPRAGRGFQLGPIRVAVHVREGESAIDAFVRARGAAVSMLETEFRMKIQDYRRRLAESEKG